MQFLLGFTVPQMTIRNGERASTYSAFLKPASGRPNLRIVTHALVEKVLISDDEKRAYAVQYRRHGKIATVRCRKEIVVSSGSIGSPQILMLSGIGPEEHLKQLGVGKSSCDK